MINIQEVKQNYDIVDIIGRHISLKPQGPEFVGNCIFHDDQHASMKVSPSKQIFKCFACDTGGDVYDFFTKQGYSIPEASKMIINDTIIPNFKPVERKIEQPKWTNVVPDQNNLPDIANIIFKDYGKPSLFWAYHDKQGNIIGYACRFNLPDGKKDVIPYTYKTNGSVTKWVFMGFDKPRPLYNLHELTARPDAIVLMVEGEKTADAGKRLFPGLVVTTWMGGADGISSADFSPLEGRRIYLWNDNDIAGIHCMFGGWSLNEATKKYKRIKGISEMINASFKRIQNSLEFPKKWDIADADWTHTEALEYLQANKTDIPSISEFPPNELPIPKPVSITLPPSPSPAPETPPIAVLEDDSDLITGYRNQYFRCLGFENNDQNLFVFFVYRTNVIVKLSAGGISVSNLLQLAPLNYWEGGYPKATRSGAVKFEINTVADDLINKCMKCGIFNPSKIRGRGAWIDEGRAILHVGDGIILEGQKVPLDKFKTKYIYEAGQELGFMPTQILDKSQSYSIIRLLERLNWSRSIEARLLAGWIVIAPLCGALNWRPHLWLTGSSGSGKSEIMKLFVKPFLGQMFVDAQGETTEAGIRQYLKADALPVVFDEAESEDRKAMERMQAVLGIMRASSTSDSGKIIKGSSGGSASQFNIRSCFAFASIGVNLTQRSDVSRISVLEIKKDLSPNAKDKWRETLQMYSDTITYEFKNALQTRSISLLPIILKNAKIFSDAVALELDNQRTGDQLGIILAGAYSLTSEKVISIEEAKKWVTERDWTEERLADSTRDEVKVINKIMDSEINVESQFGKISRTIGEIVLIARNDVVEQHEAMMISEQLAISTLKRIGIKLEGFSIIISDNSDYISKILINTAYAKNYHTILSRIDGATKTEPTVFASGIKSRATKIDTRQIFGDYENPGIKQTEINLFK